MISTTMTGLSGTNPQTFLAMVGLLRVANARNLSARLAFSADGSFHPIVVTDAEVDWPAMITEDAQSASGPQPWRLEYPKEDKGGSKLVADLKCPPEQFRQFAQSAIQEWLTGSEESTGYAAAYATTAIPDRSGKTKPTAFHFTAGQQQFLHVVECLRASVTMEWAANALFEVNSARPGPNLRWDPASDRKRALMASNPTVEPTSSCAPLEWLAFRALPAFPAYPRGNHVRTTGVACRGGSSALTWPLWSRPYALSLVKRMLAMDWGSMYESAGRALGVMSICASMIRRDGKGYGSFGPSRLS